jgi:hypothetical protein
MSLFGRIKWANSSKGQRPVGGSGTRKIEGSSRRNLEMNTQEEEKLYATFHDTVLVPYTEYKTLRKERKGGRHADLNAAVRRRRRPIISGSICRSSTRKVMRR